MSRGQQVLPNRSSHLVFVCVLDVAVDQDSETNVLSRGDVEVSRKGINSPKAPGLGGEAILNVQEIFVRLKTLEESRHLNRSYLVSA